MGEMLAYKRSPRSRVSAKSVGISPSSIEKQITPRSSIGSWLARLNLSHSTFNRIQKRLPLALRCDSDFYGVASFQKIN
jgi:hypothetical protein